MSWQCSKTSYPSSLKSLREMEINSLTESNLQNYPLLSMMLVQKVRVLIELMSELSLNSLSSSNINLTFTESVSIY